MVQGQSKADTQQNLSLPLEFGWLQSRSAIRRLLAGVGQHLPHSSQLSLSLSYQSCTPFPFSTAKYFPETIKIVPPKPDPFLLGQIFIQVLSLDHGDYEILFQCLKGNLCSEFSSEFSTFPCHYVQPLLIIFRD